MLVRRFVRQLVFASIAVAVVASNPRVSFSPNFLFYSCTFESGFVVKDGKIEVLGPYGWQACS